VTPDKCIQRAAGSAGGFGSCEPFALESIGLQRQLGKQAGFYQICDECAEYRAC